MPAPKFLPRRPLAHSLSTYSSALAVCTALGLATAAKASTISWDGGAGDNLWTTPANWVGDLAPAATDNLVFGAGGAATIDLGGNQTANAVQFSLNGFTLGSAGTTNVLTLTSGGVTVNSGITGTINALLTANDLSLSGGGFLVLSNSANALTGVTSVNGSVLRVTDAGALGAANTINSGGTLEVAGVVLDRNVTLNTGATLMGSGAASSSVGTMSVASGATVNINSGSSGQTFTLGNAANDLTGGGTGSVINVGGNGTTVLTNANDVTADWTVGSGTLQINNAAALGNAANIATVNAGAKIATSGAFNIGNSLVINGGTLNHLTANQVGLAAGKSITIGATGTIDISGGTGSSSKILLAAGQLESSAGSVLTKTGTGVIQLSGANTGFLGTVAVTGGTLEFQNADSLGTGTKSITLSNGGDFVASGGVAVRHNITLNTGGILSANGNANGDFQGTINVAGNATAALRYFQTTTTANGFKISGPLTGAGTLTVTAPAAATLTLSGNNSAFNGNITIGSNATVAAAGTAALAGNETITLSGGTLSLLSDGNGTGSPETIDFTDPITVTANSAISVGRVGTTFAPLFATAANKTIRQNGTLSMGAQTLTVNNNNGYGLEFAGSTAFSAAPTFSVATASTSTAVQGLTLSGKLTGNFGFTKTGAGTLQLANSNTTGPNANDFTGNITITNGVVGFSNDSQLGNAANKIVLNPAASSTATLRATDDITTGRTIQFATASNSRAIEVVGGKTLTLTSPFDVSAAAAAGLIKNENGTLALTVANPSTWTGGLTINAGAVLISNASALGAPTAAVTISPNAAAVGAALQLTGGITLPNPISLQGNNNVAAGGINFGGQLQSVSGANTVTGVVTMNFDAAIGADTGATLNINGGINNSTTTARALTFTGGGTINLNSSATAATGTANQYYSIQKYGAGTLNVTTANPIAFTNNFTTYGGTLSLNGAGTIVSTNTIAATVNPGANLTLDNSGTAVANRLGGRPLVLTGGNLNYVGNGTTVASETLGALTVNRGISVVTVNPGAAGANLAFGAPTRTVGGTAVFRGTNLGSAAGAGNATIASTTTGFTFSGSGAAGQPNKGIIPWALVDTNANGSGISFATADSATGILRPLAASEVSSTITAGNNVSLTTAGTLTGNTSINSLTLGSGSSVTTPAGNTLTVTSGGILALSGNSGISGGFLTQGTGELIVHAVGNLDVNSVIVGGGGGANGALTKTGAGTLTLNQPSRHIGQTIVNQGTLNLNAGNNTIALQNYMEVGKGATVNLNGNSQLVTDLFTDGAVADAGGVVTGTAGSQIVLNRDNSARNFAGSMTGAMSFVRSGQNTLTLYSNNDYTGTTLLNGGTTTLRDSAALSGTTQIDINYATLRLENAAGLIDMGNRVNDSAAINLRGGQIVLAGRAQTASREVFGPLTLAQGVSELNLSRGGVGTDSTEMVFASLNQTNNATTNFQNATGAIGNAVRIFFGNGTALMNNNILPAWIVKGGNDWASYNPTFGVGAINDTGFAGYDGTAFPAAAAGVNQNIALGANGTVAAGGQTLNTLNIRSGAFNVAFANNTDVLNLAAGGLMKTGGAATFGATPDSGRLTAGGTASSGTVPLYIHNQTNVWTMNSRIIDNPNGAAVRMVYTTYNGNNMTLAAPNTYSGGTVIQGWNGNGGTLTLGATGTIPAGGITVSNANFTQVAGGVIDPSNVITMTGATASNSGNVTLAGNNTLAGLVFDNNGGTVNPTVNTGGVLTLTGGITSTSSNPGSTPQINGTVDLGAKATTVQVDPVTINSRAVAPFSVSLNIGAAMQNGGLNKTGAGVLGISGVSTYSGQTNVNEGTLQFTGSGSIANSTVNVASGATLNVGGFNPTIGGLTGAGNVINATNGNPATAVNTLTVGSSLANASFDGLVSGAVALAKSGPGTFTLTNTANDFTGGVSVDGSTLLLRGAGINTTGSGAVTVNYGGSVSNAGLITGGLAFNPGSSSVIALGSSAPISTGAAGLSSNGPATINLTGTPSVGTFSLIDYSGTPLTTAQMAGFKVGATPGGGFLYGLVNNAADTSLDVVVEAQGAANTWTGGANGTWAPADATNWGSGAYADGQQVTFNDSGANKTISGPAVAPQAITVTNSAGKDYSIANNITGTALAGGLTKNGSGTLQLTGANTFTGAINVNGGTLRAAVSSAGNGLGAGSVTLANGTTLQLNPVASTVNTGLTTRIFNGAAPTAGVAASRNYTGNADFFGTMFATGGVDTPTDVGWVGGPADNFGAQFTGKINIPTSGIYSFFTGSDDGSRAFIDGALVAASDGGHGVIEGGSAVFLTAGLHDLRLEQTEGTGGNDEQLKWQGPGITKALVPSANIFTSENGTQAAANNHILAGNNITVSGETTINLTGSQFTGLQMGGLTAASGSKLNVSAETGKLLRLTSTGISGGGTFTLNQSADVALGQLVDNGSPVTIVKQGAGRLILDNTAANGAASNLVAGSVIDVQSGKLLVAGASGGTNPIGAASINLNGGSLLLDTKNGGAFTLNNAITATQANTLIESQATSQTITLGSASNGITLPANGTLTVDAFGGGRGGNALTNAQVAAGATVAVAGPITGSGANLTLRSTQLNGGQFPIAGNLVLSAANTYSGATTLVGQYGHAPNVHINSSQSVNFAPMTLTLNGNGSILNTSSLSFLNARLLIDNSGTNIATGQGRIADNLAINLNNSILQFTGSSGANSAETVGAVTANSGFNLVAASGTGTNLTTVLTGSSLARSNRAQVGFQGTTLGSAATNANLIKFTTAPTGLVGGGGTIGGSAKNVSILPYAVGTTSGAGTNVPTWGLVGYDSTNGIRPLSTANEYSTLGAAASGDNARSSLSASTNATPPNPVNAYVLDNNANNVAVTLTIDTNNLTINSGALVFTSSNTTASGALTLAAGTATPKLVFPTGVEGVITTMNTAAAGATIGMVISGNNGLTVGGPGQLTLNADNSTTLTGDITVNGRLVIGADNRLGDPTNAIKMNGGSLGFSAATTLAATRTVTLLGGTISGFDTATGNSVIAGSLEGGGSLAKTSGNTLTLSDPKYTGQTFIYAGTLVTTTTPQGDILNHGALNFTQTTSGTYTGTITGNGSLTVNASGQTITLGDPNDATKSPNFYSGGTTVSAGTTLRGTTTSLVNGISTATGSSVVFDQAFNGLVQSTYISGAGSVSKEGAGTVSFNADQTYTGATNVNVGTLLVNGSLSGTLGANVAANAILGGSGTINAPVTVNGTLAPGNGVGDLTINGAVAFNSGSTLSLEVTGPALGTGYDQLTIGSTGGITLNGNSTISLSLSYGAALNQVFTVVDNQSSSPIGGVFANLTDEGTITASFNGGTYSFKADYQGGDGNDLTLTVMAVPEPSSAVALVAGIASLIGTRRFRRRKA